MRRGRTVGAGLAVAAALVALLGGPAAAWGHFLQFAKVDVLRLDRDRLAVEVRYSVPDGLRAMDLRQRHDRDRDGTLDDAERGALEVAVGAEAVSALIVMLDGVPLAMHGPKVSLAGFHPEVATTRAIEAVVRLHADLALAPGEHFLSVVDRAPGDRGAVPLEITAGPGVRLGSLRPRHALGAGPPAAGSFQVEAVAP